MVFLEHACTAGVVFCPLPLLLLHHELHARRTGRRLSGWAHARRPSNTRSIPRQMVVRGWVGEDPLSRASTSPTSPLST